MSSNNNKILINTLPKSLKPAAKFIRHQEQASGLSTSRFIQDATTCLIPKVVFSRSLADLTENTFLETSEEALIYFVPTILGERVARKVFSKGLNNELKKEVATTGVELLEKGGKNNKKVIPVKQSCYSTCCNGNTFNRIFSELHKKFDDIKSFQKERF